MPKRIVLYCIEEYNYPNAIANRVQKLARGLSNAGNQVRVLSGGKSASKDWGLDNFGIYYKTLAMPWGKNRLRNYTQLVSFSRDCARSIRELAAQEGVDAVIVYSGLYILSHFTLKLRSSVGFVVLADCTEWPPFRVPRLTSPFLIDQALFRLVTLKKLNGIIAISSLWEDYSRQKGTPVIRIPSLGEVGPALESERKPGDPFRIGYVGPLSSKDLPHLMIDSFERAAASVENIILRLVGKWDSFQAGREVVQRIRNSPFLSKRVEITGWVRPEDLKRVLAEIDAFLLLRPNTWEAKACFPTRLPEFLLTGKPAILSDVGDIGLYFQHKKNSWLVSANATPDEVAQGIISLANNPVACRAIGKAGYETGQTCFGFLNHGGAISDFIDRIESVAISQMASAAVR